MTIDKFFGQYRFLSNFHLCEIEFEGLVYPSTEHAYQAAKTNNHELRDQVRHLPEPNLARRAGQMLPLVNGWNETRKFEVMEIITREKFFKHKALGKKLLDTGNLDLSEGNTWHDNVWGVCSCKSCGSKGANHLGKILMKIRDELRAEKEKT